MKKINFKNLSSGEILTRDELKRIVGGNGTDDLPPIEPGPNGCQTNYDVCMSQLDEGSFEDPSEYILAMLQITEECHQGVIGCCAEAQAQGNPCDPF